MQEIQPLQMGLGEHAQAPRDSDPQKDTSGKLWWTSVIGEITAIIRQMVWKCDRPARQIFPAAGQRPAMLN